jgi:phosphoglycerate dehydrogenase-like enzyme
MTKIPQVALALRPDLTPDFLPIDLRERLAGTCEILSDRPLLEFSTMEAQAILSNAEILLTGWGTPQIDAAVLRSAPNLRLIAHTGSSVKSVASPEVWQAGIAVISSAAANAVPVAEYALAAILFANKGVFAARERFQRDPGFWRPQWMTPGQPGNCGAVVGVIGASRTGQRLMALLRAFDLKVLVSDPFLTEDDAASFGAEKVALATLMKRSDTVTIHAPALPDTHHMIAAPELALMRDGTTIVNTARGTLVDHVALERELVSGRLNAVLDVSDPEPLPQESPLFGLTNVFLTPHVAGAAGFETRRMTELAIDEIERFVAGQPLRHKVTAEMLARIG